MLSCDPKSVSHAANYPLARRRWPAIGSPENLTCRYNLIVAFFFLFDTPPPSSCRGDNVLRVLGAISRAAASLPLRPAVGALQNGQRVAFPARRNPVLRIMVSELSLCQHNTGSFSVASGQYGQGSSLDPMCVRDTYRINSHSALKLGFVSMLFHLPIRTLTVDLICHPHVTLYHFPAQAIPVS